MRLVIFSLLLAITLAEPARAGNCYEEVTVNGKTVRKPVTCPTTTPTPTRRYDPSIPSDPGSELAGAKPEKESSSERAPSEPAESAEPAPTDD